MAAQGPAFRNRWLPYLLVGPQIAVTAVFFLWPAGQALYQSVRIQDAFGLKSRFAGLTNFVALFQSETYLHSFGVTIVYSLLVTGLAPRSFYETGPSGQRARSHYDGLPVDFVAEASSA